MAEELTGKSVSDAFIRRLKSERPAADERKTYSGTPVGVSGEDRKRTAAARQRAEEANEKWMRENGVDENGDRVTPAPSPSAIERRHEKLSK